MPFIKQIFIDAYVYIFVFIIPVILELNKFGKIKKRISKLIFQHKLEVFPKYIIEYFYGNVGVSKLLHVGFLHYFFKFIIQQSNN